MKTVIEMARLATNGRIAKNDAETKSLMGLDEVTRFAELVRADEKAKRKSLSVEKMFEAIRPLYSSDKAAWLAVNHSKDEYRAIEAAHGIKENT